MTVAPEWHDISLYFGEIRLTAALGITEWLSAEITDSLRIVAVKFQLQDLATREPLAAPFGEEIHHRSETLVGPTDPWLTARVTRRLGSWSFSFRAGVTLPIGSTVPNPFALGDRGQAHEHIQFGTGTVDPLAEVEVRKSIRRFGIAASLLGKAPLYANLNGYQAGAQLSGGLRLMSDLWTRRLVFLAGATVYHEEPERWDGIQQSEGNLGRTDLLIDTSITLKLPKQLSISLSGRFPAWTASRGEQLSTPALLDLAISRPFALFGG
jgi:hypothetical protein